MNPPRFLRLLLALTLLPSSLPAATFSAARPAFREAGARVRALPALRGLFGRPLRQDRKVPALKTLPRLGQDRDAASAAVALAGIDAVAVEERDSTETIIEKSGSFWTGARRRESAGDLAENAESGAGAYSPADSGAGVVVSAGPRLQRRALRAGGALAAAAVAAPAWAAGTVKAIPWHESVGQMLVPALELVGGIAATAYLNKSVSWAIEVYGPRLGLSKDFVMKASMVGSIVVWSSGGLLSAMWAGVPTQVILTGLGVGAMAGTLAAKDMIANALEAVKVILRQPFEVGDHILVGGELHKVRGMTLSHLETTRYSSSDGIKEYSEISNKPITVYRPYDRGWSPVAEIRGFWHAAAKPVRFLWKPIAAAARMTVAMDNRQLLRLGLWGAGSVGLLLGLPYLRDFLAWGLFNEHYLWVEGAAILFVAHSVQKWLGGMIEKFGAKHGWTAQKRNTWRLMVQGLAYMIGTSIALTNAGVDWRWLFAFLAGEGVAVAFGTVDVLTNLKRGLWALVKRKFQVDQYYEIAGVRGQLIRMTESWLVLEHSDKSHTLVPHSMTKGVLKLSEKDRNKLTLMPPVPLGERVQIAGYFGRILSATEDRIILETDDGARIELGPESLRTLQAAGPKPAS